MTTIEKYQKLKDKVEQLERDKAKAEGALEHQLKQLKDDFACSSIEDAQKLHKKLVHKAEATAEEFEEAIATFETEWGEVLRA